MKILYFFLFLWVIFALLVRIRNLNADPNPDPATQTNADPDTDPDPQPCFSYYILPVPIPYTVFLIRDILVRFPIRGSVLLTYGSGSGSFFSVTYKTPKKWFLQIFFWLLCEGRYITSFLHQSQKSRNQGFSYYFCLMMEGSRSGSVPLTKGLYPEGPKTYGSGPGTLPIVGQVTKATYYLILHQASLASK
jgi:hypothetical protein